MGARHPGDIARLVAVARPTVGILTNIGEAHLEIFGSRDELSATKWGLFSTGAQAILNAEDAESRARAGTLAKAPLWFAAVDTLDEIRVVGDCVAIVGADRLAIRTNEHWEHHHLAMPLSGRHHRANLAAALAAARHIGISTDLLISASADVELPAGRYQTLSIPSLPRIIYDAYNANPSSVRAALDTFAHEAGRRRIAVLASMAELGPESPRMHEEIGAYAATRVDELLVGGEFAEALARGAQNAGLSSEKIATFSSNGEAVALLRARATNEDVLLLKGSRRYKLEEIIERLGS
ncbi:MAG: glutamate ligase domain-containing protein, partial [Vulcanimicrobiaceae bacterium]